MHRAPPADRIPLALGWLTLPEHGPLELIPAAAAAGFDAVGLRVAPRPGDTRPAIVGDAELERAVARTLRDEGMALSEMGSIWIDGQRPLVWCRPALELGAALGARQLIALAAPQVDPGRLRDDFAQLCAWAGALGMQVAIEFAVFLGVPTLAAADALVAASGQPNAGILVDALHLQRAGGTAADVARLAAGRVHFAQLCDAPLAAPAQDRLPSEARHDRLDPGDGGLPLRALLAALPRGLPLEVEAPCLRHAGLSAHERAAKAFAASRRAIETAAAMAA